jgi:cytochrome c biogenesis protein CcdA/glutaredoxin
MGFPSDGVWVMTVGRALLIGMVVLLLVGVVRADDGQLHMLVFHSDVCPHCEAQKPFLDALDEVHAELSVHEYEVRRVAENRTLFREVATAHGVAADSVPAVFAGGRAWVGDSGLIRRQIATHIEYCLERGDCPDSRDTGQRLQRVATVRESVAFDLPLLGTIDLMMQPVTVSTALIAFVDGFNPCSLWVLTILLALVIHSGSRKRILVVGLTFLAVTASIYGLFITGVFGALNLVAMAGWLYPVVALFALVFAVVNIKDYFWFQRGLSFTIDDKHKPGIYRRMRDLIVNGRSMPALVGATALMAAGIAIIELPCTAGFPVVWSGIVASHDIDWLFFAFLLGLYLLIYLAIELVIFFTALGTLRVDRFEERHGRILKLIGGIIMLALAGVLIFAPDLMHDIRGALGVFAAALGVTVLILVLHRYLLPRMGVRIGDEW